MIIKRVFVIIKNVFTLIHHGLKYLSMRAVDYHEHLKSTIDYLDNPRYISADYDEQDIMELYTYSTDETEESTVSRNKYGYPIQSDKWYTSYWNSDLRRA